MKKESKNMQEWIEEGIRSINFGFFMHRQIEELIVFKNISYSEMSNNKLCSN